MTPRERFGETMRYGRPDRVPLFEDGLRDDVLEQWRQQGLTADADLGRMFDFDRRERAELALGPRPGMNKWPSSRRGLAAWRRRLEAGDPSRLPADWSHRVGAWRRRQHLLELPVHSGLFLTLGVDGWGRLEEVLYQLADQPALLAEMMDIYGHFVAEMVRRVLREVQVDFASFSEPIAGNFGPLLSPATYQQVVLPGYRPILEQLRRGRVETIVLVSYANIRPLLPGMLEAGFNCLWVYEAHSQAMDYRALRRQFGRSLRLIGGIDLDALLKGKTAIEHELRSKVPPLLADGGYIPLADGRVRANIPFANYAYYRRMLQELTQTCRPATA